MGALCEPVRPVLRVHRIPFSTNVERVALAAAYKDVEVAWVDHDAANRSAIRELSGQDLVPVAEFAGEVVVDSMAIVERLEQLVPEPSLYPADPAARAAAEAFVTWFNVVWKGPPNELADELDSGAPDGEKVAELAGLLQTRLGVFEHRLADGDYLFGDMLTVADVCAFPFRSTRSGRIPTTPRRSTGSSWSIRCWATTTRACARGSSGWTHCRARKGS